MNVLGYIYVNGTGCGDWDAHVMNNAATLGLKYMRVGPQQCMVNFEDWGQVPVLLTDVAFRSVTIEVQRGK